MSYKNKSVLGSAPKKPKRKWWVAAIIVIFVLVAAGGTWKVLHDRNKKPAITASSSTKGEPIVSGSSANSTAQNTGDASTPAGSNQTTQPTQNNNAKQDQTPAPTSGVTLQAPSGNFVSSHTNVPMGATEQSVCTTTPGATCTITFTQNGVTKPLQQSQVTDRGGSAYWTWTPGSIGLTAGNWTITATATLNGQTQSTTDQLPLKVS